MAEKKQKTYVVTAPYVTLQTDTTEGVRILGYYQGAVVPSDVPADQLKHHLDSNLIAEEKDAEAVVAAETESPPSGAVPKT